MADTKISALTAATTLATTDELVLAVAGANKKITGANLKASFVGAELDYVERTSALSITNTTDATAETFITGNAVTYDGSTRIRIEFTAPYASTAANNNIVVTLWDGSTDLGRIAATGASIIITLPMVGVRYLTPSAASHTYYIKTFKTGAGTFILGAGAGGSSVYMPSYMRISRA